MNESLHTKLRKLPLKGIFFSLVFCILATPLYSQVITSIEIIGLKRTQLHVAKYPLEKFLGQDSSSFNENDAIAAVKDMGILEPVSAELVQSKEELTLRVTVEEKWSIFPFPLIYVGSDGNKNFGLFFCDFNAFGLRDMAVLGGLYGSNGWSAIAMYNHTPAHKNALGWSSIFMYIHQERKNVDRHNETIRIYSANRLFSSLGVNYDFFKYLNGSISLYFTDISPAENKDSYNSPEDGARFIGISPRLSLRNSNWDGYLLSSQNLSFGYNYNHAISGSSFHQLEYSGNYEKPLVPGFRLNLRSGGIWKSATDPLFKEDQKKALVNVLPENYFESYYAGLSAGLEKYLFKSRHGTLSAQGLWQGVFSGDDVSHLEFDHGPFGGIVFYLSRVALPAVGFGFAYNMVSGQYRYSFSVGMSF
ncbi:MAG: hypothetical protein FWC26_02765 [Fibromonadales bacterium]|nr:hypothetical protein [Fibromonadales bacterium]